MLKPNRLVDGNAAVKANIETAIEAYFGEVAQIRSDLAADLARDDPYVMPEWCECAPVSSSFTVSAPRLSFPQP